jgi:hypothetical protein
MIGGMTRIRLTVATLGADKKLLKLILLRSLVEDNILDGVVFRTLRTIDISGNLLFFRRVVSILSKTATQTVIIHPLNMRASLDQLRAQCGTPGCVATSFTSARLIAETNGHLRF